MIRKLVAWLQLQRDFHSLKLSSSCSVPKFFNPIRLLFLQKTLLSYSCCMSTGFLLAVKVCNCHQPQLSHTLFYLKLVPLITWNLPLSVAWVSCRQHIFARALEKENVNMRNLIIFFSKAKGIIIYINKNWTAEKKKKPYTWEIWSKFKMYKFFCLLKSVNIFVYWWIISFKKRILLQ